MASVAVESPPTPELLSTGDLARRFEVHPDVIRKLVERLGVAHRIGRHRAIFARDIPSVRAGLLALGHPIPAEA